MTLPSADRFRTLRPSDLRSIRDALASKDGHWALYGLVREYLIQWRNPREADLDEIGGVAAQLSSAGLESRPELAWFLHKLAPDVDPEAYAAFVTSLTASTQQRLIHEAQRSHSATAAASLPFSSAAIGVVAPTEGVHFRLLQIQALLHELTTFGPDDDSSWSALRSTLEEALENDSTVRGGDTDQARRVLQSFIDKLAQEAGHVGHRRRILRLAIERLLQDDSGLIETPRSKTRSPSKTDVP